MRSSSEWILDEERKPRNSFLYLSEGAQGVKQ